MVRIKICDGCGEELEFKLLSKINKKYYCKDCALTLRHKHREETLENSEDKEKIKDLEKEIKRAYSRKYYERDKKNNIIKKEKNTEEQINKRYIPKRYKTEEERINLARKKISMNMTLEERQLALKIIMEKGIIFEEAKRRVDDLRERQKEIIKQKKEEKKTEEEIKLMQEQMIKDLANF